MNCLKIEHAPLSIGVLGREAVGVLRTDRGSDIIRQPLNRPRGLFLSLSHVCLLQMKIS